MVKRPGEWRWSGHKVKSELGFKAAHREVKEMAGTYTPREQSEAYGINFAG